MNLLATIVGQIHPYLVHKSLSKPNITPGFEDGPDQLPATKDSWSGSSIFGGRARKKSVIKSNMSKSRV